jgi:Ku70/Ku80 beta-barrel domain
MDRTRIPLQYCSGPPSLLTGLDSQKACAAISALAQALERQGKVAVGTFQKTTRSTVPALVAVFPFTDAGSYRLITLQLPYEGEVKRLDLSPLAPYVHESKCDICDDVIDSLMLEEHHYGSGQVPSHFHRAWHQTVMQRALDPESPIVKVEKPVIHVSREAVSAIDKFQTNFPCMWNKEVKKKPTKKGAQTGSTYTDFVDDHKHK